MKSENRMTDTGLRIAEAVSDYTVELSQTGLAEMIASHKTLERANDALSRLTGIRRFFENQQEFEEFRRLIALPAQSFVAPKSREWGDFQTPSGVGRTGGQLEHRPFANRHRDDHKQRRPPWSCASRRSYSCIASVTAWIARLPRVTLRKSRSRTAFGASL